MSGFFVLAASERLTAELARANPQAVQPLLRAAKQREGHALCCCVEPPRRLVIRERSGVLHLAVWPEDGPRHDPACPFHREAGSAIEQGQTVEESDDGLEVRLAFQLERRAWLHEEPPPANEGLLPATMGANSHAPCAALALGDLLDLLWARADLHRWMPGWTRDYWRVHRQLSMAVSEVRVGRRELADILEVLPQMRANNKEDADRAWSRIHAALTKFDRKACVASHLVLGELRGLEQTRHGWALYLRHFRSPIFLDQEAHARLAKAFPRAVVAMSSRAHSPSAPRQRVVGIVQIELTAHENLRLVEATLRVTDAHYLPIKSDAEAALCQNLIDRGRNFAVMSWRGAPLRADVELRDTEPRTAMFVSLTQSHGEIERVQRATHEMRLRGWAIWHWQVAATPALPALPDVEVLLPAARPMQ